VKGALGIAEAPVSIKGFLLEIKVSFKGGLETGFTLLCFYIHALERVQPLDPEIRSAGDYHLEPTGIPSREGNHIWLPIHDE
jgi:hypothetical protein